MCRALVALVDSQAPAISCSAHRRHELLAGCVEFPDSDGAILSAAEKELAGRCQRKHLALQRAELAAEMLPGFGSTALTSLQGLTGPCTVSQTTMTACSVG